MLNCIDKNLTREEIEYIFNKFDEDGNNKIEFAEFTNLLSKHNIYVDSNDL